MSSKNKRNISTFRELLSFGTPEKSGELWKNESRIIENRGRMGGTYIPLAPGYSGPADEDGQFLCSVGVLRNRSNSIQSRSIHWIKVFQLVMFHNHSKYFLSSSFLDQTPPPPFKVVTSFLDGPLRKFQQHEKQILA